MKRLAALFLSFLIMSSAAALAAAPPATNPQSGAVGLGGRITGNAPTQAPSITTPSNGSSFTTLPIKVAGLCNSNYLVELFKNNVFSGSAQCAGGSYSLQIDLFSGQNDLIAKQFDGLNRSSPDSNKVSVSFNDSQAVSGPRVSLQTAYATRGANPGTVLTWPLTITGGAAPYAVSVDWGDGSEPQLISEKLAGDFNISHTYSVAGSYNVSIKATDADSNAAFLQVVAIGNGAVQQSSSSASSTNNTNSSSASSSSSAKTAMPAMIALSAMVVASFWLGRKHQMASIRDRIKKGERPF